MLQSSVQIEMPWNGYGNNLLKIARVPFLCVSHLICPKRDSSITAAAFWKRSFRTWDSPGGWERPFFFSQCWHSLLACDVQSCFDLWCFIFIQLVFLSVYSTATATAMRCSDMVWLDYSMTQYCPSLSPYLYILPEFSVLGPLQIKTAKNDIEELGAHISKADSKAEVPWQRQMCGWVGETWCLLKFVQVWDSLLFLCFTKEA